MKPARSGFLLGNYPDLSLFELTTVLWRTHPHLVIDRVAPALAVVPDLDDLGEVVNQTGGVVKAGDIWQGLFTSLPKIIAADLVSKQSHQACLSSPTKNLDLNALGREIKLILTAKAYPFRFRFPEKITATAGVNQTWSDYVIFPGQATGSSILLLTRVAQDIAWWGKKDYLKPKINPRQGMLPPKIARMMVNCAFPKTIKPSNHLLDPFCGTGTICLEALDLGCLKVFGSDINPAQVGNAQANLDWFTTLKSLPKTYTLAVSDVMTLKLTDYRDPFEAIVFEGFLGPPDLPSTKIQGLKKGLLKMYTGVFKRLAPLIKPGGRVVAALPVFVTDCGVQVTLESLIDTCENLGYTLLVPPLIIGRPGASIKREIFIFSLT